MSISHVGAFVVGVIVGYFLFYFLRRTKNFKIKDYGYILGVMFGGAVLTFLGKMAAYNKDETLIWYYPLGIVAGLMLYTALMILLLALSGGDDGGPGSPKGPRRDGQIAWIAWELKKVLLFSPPKMPTST